jgi:F-type H+-transporting ATPase subunit b
MTNVINSIILLSHESHGFGLNTNIIETNLINIALLLGLLIFVVGGNLRQMLDDRYVQILNTVQEAEERLTQAKARLSESTTQWNQIRLVINDLKAQALKDQEKAASLEMNRAESDLTRRIEKATSVIQSREKRFLSETIQEISSLIFNQVIQKLQTEVTSEKHSFMIDKKIEQLGGKL